MQLRCNENVAVLIALSLHNNKAKLKSFLLEDVPPSEPLPGAFRTITDGDAFLRCCKWKKNDLFGDIFQKYIDIKGLFGIDVVLFDGYAVSNKDCAHKKRTEKKLNIVDILDGNPCPVEQELFFANYNNKDKFISELARMLESEGVNVVMCSCDADISQKQHLYQKHYKENENNGRACYRIYDVVDNLDQVIFNFILFAYTFTCCDLASTIHNFGNKQFFQTCSLQ